MRTVHVDVCMANGTTKVIPIVLRQEENMTALQRSADMRARIIFELGQIDRLYPAAVEINVRIRGRWW